MSVKRNTEGLRQSAQRKRQAALDKVEQGIRQLIKDGKTINFNTVAAAAGVSKAFLYKESAIKERIEQLRQQGAQSKPPPKQRASDASKDNLITMLRSRIKALEAENQALRRQNEVAYGHIIEIGSLRQQVERLSGENEKLRSQSKFAHVVPTDSPKIADIEAEVIELGIQMNTTLSKLIREAPPKAVRKAIDSLKEAVAVNRVENRAGFLNRAIRDLWAPNEEYKEKLEKAEFNKWWKLAYQEGLVIASQQINGVLHVCTSSGEWMSFEEAEKKLHTQRSHVQADSQ